MCPRRITKHCATRQELRHLARRSPHRRHGGTNSKQRERAQDPGGSELVRGAPAPGSGALSVSTGGDDPRGGGWKHDEQRDATGQVLRGFLQSMVIPPTGGLLQVTGHVGVMLEIATRQTCPADTRSPMLVAGAAFDPCQGRFRNLPPGRESSDPIIFAG
jgi:hypothetical protein